MRCRYENDIDLVVEQYAPANENKYDTSEIIQNACDWEADILWFDNLDKTERVYEDANYGLVLK